MMSILKLFIPESAVKKVLLMMTLTLCIGVFTGHVDTEVFKTAIAFVFGFYFGYKGDNNIGPTDTNLVGGK